MQKQPTLPETITVPTGLVLEALAAIDALGQYDAETTGRREYGKPADTVLQEWCCNKAGALSTEIFGDPGDDDPGLDGYATDPAIVATDVLSSRYVAELHELKLSESWTARRARAHRRRADKVHEEGTIEVMFPDEYDERPIRLVWADKEQTKLVRAPEVREP